MTISPAFFKKKSATLASSSLLLLTMTVTGCQSVSESSEAIVSQPTSSSSMPSNADSSQQTFKQQSLRIQHALANGDYASITNDIHPTRGVRFSMYAYIRPETDKVFSRGQYAQYLQQSKIRFTWGEKDGTGDLLITPLPDYLSNWVAASAFDQNAEISINSSKAMGNSINNLNKIYQNSDFVEFYSNGSEKYSGMDWRAMRLVFEEYQGKRYLVAVINDQWTV
ncbi:hypothetical protein [Psychrobacter sp. Pi2-51]|uniref:hypothetical protein n=1 Tax=Psychrobacter sp. Pi2-51 TaxID=2774132 RepID=UPI00191AADDF|nr:hypothetical protein [Psychrobacter sp. Pi2-51]